MRSDVLVNLLGYGLIAAFTAAFWVVVVNVMMRFGA
jgi:hypothetical protein